MSDVTNLFDKNAGVVEFGARDPGYTAIVESRAIPRLTVMERGGNEITICLDRRFMIDVPRNMSEMICWMIANALAGGGQIYPIRAEGHEDRGNSA